MSSWEGQFGFKNRKEIVFLLPKPAEDLLWPCPSLQTHNPHFFETGKTRRKSLTTISLTLYPHKKSLWKLNMQKLNVDNISTKSSFLILWIKSKASRILRKHPIPALSYISATYLLTMYLLSQEYVSDHVHTCLCRPEEGMRYPGTGYRQWWGPW